jgi:fused signal recognition particle receptor
MKNIFKALTQTREKVTKAFNILTQNKVASDSIDELEQLLLSADMGYETVESILNLVKNNKDEDFIINVQEHLIRILPKVDKDLTVFNEPSIIIVIGVNGTGKTTTVAKLAKFYKDQNNEVLMIAADTYRAAAVDQLKLWSKRLDVKIVYNDNSQQPSSVLFDGLNAAKSNQIETVIVDTAGRLHTYKNLMQELEKIYFLAKNKFPEYNVSTLMTLDASFGQNSLIQVKEFLKFVEIDSAILTKMDGTAKGGIVFPLYKNLNVPVSFLGLGEDIDDLIIFDSSEYVKSLIGTNE